MEEKNTNTHYLDIGYGFAKELAIAGRIPATAQDIANLARSVAKELILDFTVPNGKA